MASLFFTLLVSAIIGFGAENRITSSDDRSRSLVAQTIAINLNALAIDAGIQVDRKAFRTKLRDRSRDRVGRGELKATANLLRGHRLTRTKGFQKGARLSNRIHVFHFP